MKIEVLRSSDISKFKDELNNFIKDKEIIDIKYFQEFFTEGNSHFDFKKFARTIELEPNFIYTAIIEYKESK